MFLKTSPIKLLLIIQFILISSFLFANKVSASESEPPPYSFGDIKFIKNDDNGGDCILIGIWEANTKTCKLTRDLSETIQIDSDGITLDGNRKFVRGINKDTGILLIGRSGVTIKNLSVESFRFGIGLLDSSNNFLINNTISKNSSNGIFLYRSNNNDLRDNFTSFNGYEGIFLNASNDNLLSNNTASSNGSEGIYFYGSNNNFLESDIASSNLYGIRLKFSNSNYLIDNYATSNRLFGIHIAFSTRDTLTGNTMFTNSHNFFVGGFSDSEFDHNIDISNKVDGGSIYYVVNANNKIFNKEINAGTFYCIHCNNITIQDLVLNKNGNGIFLWYTDNSTIKNNTISNNIYGIQLQYSDSNRIYNNNFINNSIQAFLYNSKENIFNATEDIGGNYWTNFDSPSEGCSDVDNNKICDSPYIFLSVQVSTQDSLPWITKEGWLKPPSQFWSEINNASNGALSIIESNMAGSTIIKTLPNNLVLKVLDTTDPNGWYKVEDITDNTIGWVHDGSRYLNYDKNIQDALQNKANVQFLTKQQKIDKTIESVNYYYNNTDNNSSLYSSNDSKNHISIFKESNFPLNLILGIASWESGVINFDNEWVTDDYGHGIFQITSRNYLGLGSSIGIPSCSSLDPLSSNYYRNCYGVTYEATVPDKFNSDGSAFQWAKRDYVSYKYYTNTHQSIFSNIKDALRALQEKFQSVKNTKAVGDITADEMRNISAVYRYNQGSPYRVQAAYEIWSGNTDLEYLWSQYLNRLFTTKTKAANWIQQVSSICTSGSSFENCLINTDKSDLTISALYLRNVGSQLESSPFGSSYEDSVLANKLVEANNSRIVLSLRSPGEPQIIDSIGEVIGVVNGIITENIPNSIYDSDTKSVTILFPQDSYKYRVVGTDNGQYGLTIDDIRNGDFTVFNANDIPTSSKEIHEYTVDWDALNRGEKGVTIQVDKEGDGTFNYEFQSSNTLQDNVAPETQASPVGTLGNNNWYISNVQVSLSASDNEDGVGVLKTEYSLDSGNTWNVYSGPLVFSNEGVISILYRSQDFLGNVEDIKSVEVKIDKTPPEASIYLDHLTRHLRVTGIDNLSSVSVDREDKLYILEDDAGNILRLNFKEIKENKNELKARLLWLQYNDKISISVSDNEIKYEWSLDKNQAIKELEEKISLKTNFEVSGKYKAKDNITKISVHNDILKTKNEIKLKGLIIIRLLTDNGNLLYDL